MQSAKTVSRIQVNRQWVLGLMILVFLTTMFALAFYIDASVTPIYWLVGVTFGITVQRSRFCFTSAFRDFFLLGQTRMIKGVFVGLAVSTVGFVMVMSTVSPNPGFGLPPTDANILPVGLSTLVAGVLFGIGMVLAGGCISGSLYRMGEGYIASWITIIGVMIGLFILNNTWNWWWDNLISNEPVIWIPSEINYTWTLMIICALLVMFLYIAVRRERSLSKGFVMPNITKKNLPVPSGPLTEVLGYLTKLFQKEWSPLVGGAVLGILNILLFIRFHPLGVLGEISRWTASVANMVGLPELELRGMEDLGACALVIAEGTWLTDGLFLNVGIIVGSAASSIFSKEFKLRIPQSPARYVQSVVGGGIMGYGGGLGLGCTLGAFFSAVPSLALSGWVYAIGLAVGAYIGVQWIKRFP